MKLSPEQQCTVSVVSLVSHSHFHDLQIMNYCINKTRTDWNKDTERVERKKDSTKKAEGMNDAQRDKMTKGRKGETGTCLQNVILNSHGREKNLENTLVGLKASKGVSSMS